MKERAGVAAALGKSRQIAAYPPIPLSPYPPIPLPLYLSIILVQIGVDMLLSA
jgi:hypothetical protein